ncbi:hypothetical protein LK07_30835 [Streptomyces pluripotens]|uniref:Uncharacterized protein n=1 Tax=Streptomyces pluripotens TaxID=1355015 RepID=A0A221P617_9ACTN|nr:MULTISPECIES: hypothetical protein [Streptomyces]ARP73450.1 hypothetical protein LK06_029640 [Streptomyces pluripotens]ASN27701.1 hypothetical protein LK07_30835 [Streptomyces pluripotens]KIE26891.1 hypothetical protein LK08_11735 [Streptomyces sp. MUSC 125]
MEWIPTGDVEIALHGRKVVCRHAAGRRLESVPATIADVTPLWIWCAQSCGTRAACRKPGSPRCAHRPGA